MNMFKKMTSFAALAVVAASPALAQPTLVGTFEGVTPEGNNSFLFTVVTENPTASVALEFGFSASSISEEGTVSFFGGAVTGTSDTFDEATNSDNLSNNVGDGTEFNIEEDTYYFDSVFATANPGNNPFTGGESTGFVQTPTTLFLAFGTPTNIDPGLSNPLVRIVTPDDSVEYQGLIAQLGTNTLLSGSVAVPEPTTAALLGLGGLALLSRKRREA